jgi:hypothetical protein
MKTRNENRTPLLNINVRPSILLKLQEIDKKKYQFNSRNLKNNLKDVSPK